MAYWRPAGILLLLLPILFVTASAYSSTQLNTLLVSYNISPGLIAQLTPVYLNVSGVEYILLYNHTMPYFLVNASSDSFVINASSIYSVIHSYIFNQSYASLNFSQLAKQMKAYQASSSGPIDDCLHETGLDTGLTCNLSNYCYACQVVPVCKAVLDNTSGPTGVLGQGIMEFEKQYNALNKSYSAFYASTSNVTKANVLQKIAQLMSSFANITNLTTTLHENPIFPPENVTPNMLATCTSYYTPTSAPWYCTALGFCEALTFNTTLLGKMQDEINAINSTPLSNEQIFSLAERLASTELGYVLPVLSKQHYALLQHILNTQLSNYSTLISSVSSLLSHVNNSTLLNSTLNLEKAYASLQSNYLTENITQQAQIVASMLNNVSEMYAKLNATYAHLLSLADNNTASLIKAELTNPYQQGLASLAFLQLSLNKQLSGSISNVSSFELMLSNLSSKLKHYQTSSYTLADFARGIDGAFARPIVYSMHLPYASAKALAPFIGSLLALIIGIVVLGALAFVRSYLKLKRKIVVNEKTRRNWLLLFAIVGVGIILYYAASLSLLEYANAHASPSTFYASLQNAKDVIIAINGTPTLNAYSCASSIGARLGSMGKHAVLISLANGLCKVGNATVGEDYCLNYYSALNDPIIMLSNSSQAGIGIYSLYGTLLSYSGNATVMQACYPYLLLN
ncbi:MAG: hypothetical protein ACP5IK_03375 [Candidatus Micrarchaeia archaeon]